jgi:hypothetical protein
MKPTVTPEDVRPRGPTSSAEYNKLTSDLFYDLSRLYASIEESDEATQKLIHVLLQDSIFLQRRILALENALANVMDEIRSLPTKRMIMLPSSMVTSRGDYENTKKPLFIENEYRVVTLPRTANAVSKTHLVDSETSLGLVPKELVVDIYPFNAQATDTGTKNAFDGSNSTYFERRATYLATDPISEEECLMVITLPTNIVNNLLANSIIIKPFPENSLDIVSVYYNRDPKPQSITFTQEEKDDHDAIIGKGWELVPAFPRDINDDPAAIVEASRIKLSFPSVAISSVAIRLKQRNWIEDVGNKVFLIGAREVEVLYESYEMAGGYILTPFEPTLPNGVGTYDILNIRHHFANNGALSSVGMYNETTDTSGCLSYEVYEEVAIPGGVALLKLADLSGIMAERCWIATTLYPDPIYKCTPVLDYIEVEYSTN